MRGSVQVAAVSGVTRISPNKRLRVRLARKRLLKAARSLESVAAWQNSLQARRLTDKRLNPYTLRRSVDARRREYQRAVERLQAALEWARQAN